MAFLTDTQVQKIKEHMIAEDATMLASKFKSKNTPYDLRTIELNEVDDYENDGWEVVTTLKRKSKVQREKDSGRKFEDDVWCMFYNLGFRTLNYDDQLVVQWGPSAGDHHQLDVVAVDDEAIFVVECKAADKIKNANFKKEIDNLCQYKEGVTKALRQIYGEKKVKFIFAASRWATRSTRPSKRQASRCRPSVVTMPNGTSTSHCAIDCNSRLPAFQPIKSPLPLTAPSNNPTLGSRPVVWASNPVGSLQALC